MRKNITYLAMSLFLLMGMSNVFAQDKYGAEPEKCGQYLSLFHESVKGKNFKDAYEYWLWCFENCPKASKLIYSDGLKIAEDKAEQGEKEVAGKLIDDIYTKRVQYFPDNLGKVYSDWSISLEERGESNEKVFEKLDLGFKADPSGLSVKNMAKYFQEVTNRNKDTNVQKVFDTYDDVLEAVNVKIDKLSQELDKVNTKETAGQKLSSRDKRKQKNNGINLRGLGQVEDVLDQIIGEVATCDRLIPLYDKSFEENKNNAVWLRRAASRLNAKECTEDAMYPKIVEAYVHADPSPSAFIFYAQVLEERGQASKAIEYRNKAVDIETNPYKKAKYLYQIANTMKRRSKSESRRYALRALQAQPSLGHAYLLIANLYASSANSCGTDEFSKRMVYVAAADKARQAKAVDPSITSTANRYIKSYDANSPSTKMIFQMGLKSGTPHKVECWIGETVRIP
jgi:tetratricopeptide (TPR) repeat protein